LGPVNRAAAERDAAMITEAGQQPLLTVLVSPQDGAVAAVVLAITVALSPTDAPSCMVH